MIENKNNSSIIKRYLYWILGWTLVTISIYTIVLVFDKFDTYKKFSKLDKQTKLLKEVSNVLYETQNERGLSAKYLVVVNEVNKDILLSQREKTDNSVNNLYIYINEALIGNEYGILELTDELNSNIQMLDVIRHEVDNISLDSDQAIEYYTHSLNTNILYIIDQISSSFYELAIAKELKYYNFTTNLREIVGVVRARAFDFPNNRYTDKAFIQSWFNYQYLYDKFIGFDSLAVVPGLNNLQKLNSEFDSIAYSTLEQNNSSFNMTEWWTISTLYLNSIYEFENNMVHQIIRYVEQKKESVWNDILILILINILILVISFLYASSIMRRVITISNDIESEHHKVNNIFNSQKSIVITTDGKVINSVNSAFFDNFDFKDLDDFLSQYSCICELFIDKPDVKHLMPDMGGISWVNHILMHQDENHEAYMLDKYDDEHVYEVQVNSEVGDTAVVVFTDITKLKQQEDLLREQSRMASMGELIGMIAHQWRQPLTAMSALVGKVKLRHQLKQLDDDMLKKSIAKHKELVIYMDRTINNFLNFYKPSNEITEINTTDMLTQPYKLIENLYKKHNISFKLNDIVNTNIALDVSKFEQVLMNIYKNAADEMIEKNQKDGMLNVDFYEDEINYIVDIEDNAGGIPEDILSNIFDPYFSTKSKNGTGLGLYMSKIIIEDQLGGVLSAFNQDEGAIFRITLPKRNIK